VPEIPQSLSTVRSFEQRHQATAALRIRNGVTKLLFLAHVIARIFCNGPLISQHFRRPVTPEVAGSSPVAPAKDFNDLAFRVRFCDTFGPAPVTLFVGFSLAPGLLSGPINGSYTFYVN
jgi:hypothetical protein